MSTRKKIFQKATLGSRYMLTNSFALVQGATGAPLSFKCLKTGYYNIKALVTFLFTNDVDDGYAYIGIGASQSSNVGSFVSQSATDCFETLSLFIDNMYVKKGEVVAVYAKYIDAGGSIEVATGLAEPFLSMQEV